MVYVLNVEGRPLMPTGRHGHVRRMLRDGKARVVRRCPFTIQLMCEGTSYTQPVHLGIDAGSKRIGVSAATEKEVLYEAEVELRNDIKELLSSRREARRARRNRKTRYRKPRFLNRTKAKRKGWLAPSVEQKVQTHLTVIRKACGILPVSKITIETASFDTQMLRAKELGLSLPAGTDYQQGEQLYSWNVREYVLFRDGHTCRCCKGKSKDGVLEVHHIESRKTGGDAPNNLVTLCRTCHEGHHRGTVKLPEDIKRGNRYNDAAFMGIMRWKVYDRLKEEYGPDMVHMTYGYITKRTRIRHGLQKGHRIDARCISGHPDVAPPEEVFFQKKIRCHNRQIHKFGIPKGGVRKRNQAPYLVKGFRLFDKVEYGGQECFIFGRRSSGYFDVRLLDGTKVHAGVSYRKLRFLEPRRTMLIERRTQGTTAWRSSSRHLRLTAKRRGFPCCYLMNHYFTFDRINNEKILSFYSRKPIDFGGAALEAEGRKKLIKSIEADFGYKFRTVKQCTKQVHGDRVVIVDEQNLDEETGPADGLLTDLRGVALEIHTADCQSVFLYDPVRGVIGNVHSGWKGTVQKIAPKAAQRMIDHYGSSPRDIEIYINPSILECCFEIEEDVVEQFAGIVDVSKYCRKDRIEGGRQKYFMDTTAVNRDLLAALGIPKENIFLSGVCTMCGHKEYHSYRGDHHVTGRNGSMICLK